jgi:predicted RNA-binding protein
VLAHDLLAVVVGVDGVAIAEVLDAAREELQQLGELDLAARDDDASQRNALLSLSKNPSSVL